MEPNGTDQFKCNLHPLLPLRVLGNIRKSYEFKRIINEKSENIFRTFFNVQLRLVAFVFSLAICELCEEAAARNPMESVGIQWRLHYGVRSLKSECSKRSILSEVT